MIKRWYGLVLRRQRIAEAEAAMPSSRRQAVRAARSLLGPATMDVLEPRLMLSGSPWEVSLAAEDRFASEQDADPAAIIVTRTDTGTGDIGQPLTVNYTVGGTAEAAEDYQALTGTVEIPAGQSSASIVVTPMDDGEAESDERVILTLVDGAEYDVAPSAETALVTLVDNDPGVVPTGDGFAVNTTTNNEQKLWQQTGSELAALPDGGLVSVWNSIGQDGSYWGVYGQIFDDAGAKVGGEFQVNTHTTLSQYHASVSADAAGNFVVIWTSTGGQDGNLAGVFARRFDGQGNALSGEFQINTTTTGTQEMPEVSFLADGRFAAVWTGKGPHDNIGVMARIFNADGTAVTGEIAVNTHTSNQQQYAALAALPDGGFLVAWTSYLGQDGSVRGVFAQRFDSAGAASGAEFQINTTTQGDQQYPAIAVAPEGNVVIVWQSDNGDGSGTCILGQQYDAAGQTVGGEFLVNSFTTYNQWYPSVAFGPEGRFLASWCRYGSDVSGVHAREFAADGTPLRDQFSINPAFVPGTQTAPIVIGGDDGYVVAWSGNGSEDSLGIYARIFVPTNTPPTTTGIADVNVDEDAPETIIDLFGGFADTEHLDEQLSYAVVGITNPVLLAAGTIDQNAGTLTLAYAPDANGTSEVTVRATDPRGLFAETTFNVVVAAVNDAPTTTGIADVAVDEDAPATVIDLAAAFDDIETDDANLTYEVVGNTDPSLFSSVTMGQAVNLVGATDGLLGHWRLDDAGTTALDSADDNDGTLAGGPVWVEGYTGGALQLDGIDDSVGLGNPAELNFTGPITIAAWIKPEATDGLRNIVAHGYHLSPHGEVFLRIANGQYQIGSWNGSDHKTAWAIPSEDIGSWVHLAGTYDGTTWRLYRNGVEVAAAANATGAVLVEDSWAIGARGTGTERFFDGTVDDVRIYDRALTAEEVAPVSNGELTLAYAPDANGSAAVTVRATDPEGASAETTFNVVVAPVNDVPTTSGIADVGVDEDAPATAIDLATSFDDIETGDADLTYEVTANTNPSLFSSTDISSTELTLAYALNANGSAAIAVRASDPEGASVETTFNVVVAAVNDTPTTAGIADITVDGGTAESVIDLAAAFADIEDASTDLTYAVADNTNPALVSSTDISAGTGELTLVYAAGQIGTADLTVRATDSGGLYVETTLGVEALNTAPLALGIPNVSILEDSSPTYVDLHSAFADIQDSGELLTYEVVSNTNGGVVVPLIDENGQLSFAYEGDAFGTAMIAIRATDTGGLYAENAVIVDVDAVNDAPVIGALLDGPDPAIEGADLTLEIDGLTDDSADVSVAFYRDADANGELNVAVDHLLGVDTMATNGGGFEDWSITVSTGGFGSGAQTYFAQATDSEGVTSAVVSATGTVGIIGVIDDGEPGYEEYGSYEEFGEAWADGTTADGYKGDHREHAAGVGASKALWTFTGLADGPHKVYLTWVPGSDRATNAPFTVHDGTVVEQSFAIDQQAAPTVDYADGAWWHLLGTYEITSGELVVQLTDEANGVVVADAVRVIDPPPTIGSLSADRDRVIAGDQIVLTADDVADTDGTVTSVAFYRDSNDNDTLEVGTDELLQTDTVDSDGWGVTVDTSASWSGGQTFFAQATDNDSLTSDPAATDVTVVDDVTTNLLGHWRLNDASGTVAEDAAGGNDGTLINGPAWIDGSAGGALDFDGTNDYVALGNPSELNFTGQLTIAAWVKADATGGLRNIVAHGHHLSPHGEVYLRIANGEYQIGSWNGSDHGTAFAIPGEDIGQWVHLAGSYDGSTWRLYRDGVEVAATANATGAVLVQDNWAIGARGTGTERFFDGGIDDARIYDRALTDAEIIVLADKGIDHAPVINDQTFAVPDNPIDGSVIGTVAASDADLVDTVSYAITAGNQGGAFALDSASGELTVADAETLDFATNPLYQLTVEAANSPDSGLSDTAVITIFESDVTDGLLGHWKLDDMSDATAADSVGDNDGTVAGATWDDDGHMAGALRFDGSGDYVSLGNPSELNLSGHITISAWIKPEATNGTRNIVAHGYSRSPNGEVYLRLADGQYQIGSWNGAGHGAVYAIPSGDVGSWVHLTGTHDGTYWRLYRNGVEVASTEDATGAVTVNGNWAIGARGNGGERFFDGTIDDVRIYGRSLSGPEAVVLASNYTNSAPQIATQGFDVPETASDGTVVGTVLAVDADVSDTIYFEITAGNHGDAFTIDPSNGQITVADSSAMDFVTYPVYNLTVKVTDDGYPALSGEATVQIAPSDLTEGLVGHWHLDEATGTLAQDATANDNDGSVTGNPAWVPGREGASALEFDGNGDYVSLGNPDELRITGDITLSAWVRPEATDGFRNIIAHGHAFNPNGEVYLRIADGQYQVGSWNGGNHRASFAVPSEDIGNWVLLTGTHDGTTWRLYRNGTEVASSADSVGAVTVNDHWAIGARGNGGERFFEGAIDEVRIYNRALTAAEAQALIDTAANAGPEIEDQTFATPADSTVGTVVGTVIATDVDEDDTLSFAIMGWNVGDAFAIDSATGQITVAATLNFNTNPVYNLVVEVTDDGDPARSDYAVVSIMAGDVSAGLLGHWQLDDAGTTALDSAGDNDGTLAGGPVWVDGYTGGALQLDGTNDCVGLGSPAELNFTGPITIAAWVRPEATDGLRNIVAHGYHRSPNGEVFLRIANGQYQIGSWNGSDHKAAASIPSGDIGQWVHLTGSYDGSAWRLYRNGTQVAGAVDATGAVLVQDNWAIGARGTGTERFFDGTIDDVRIYGRAINDAEIAVLIGRQPEMTAVSGPSVAMAGMDANLTAEAYDPVGTVITSVEFYRDDNANGTLDVGTDVLVHTDSDGSNGWSAAAPTTGLAGEYAFFARGSMDGSPTSAVATTVTVSPDTAVADNGDSAYAEPAGAWSDGQMAGAYGQGYRQVYLDGATNTATWTFDDLPDGNYAVYTTHVAAANHAEEAGFAIYNGSVDPNNIVTSATIDQQATPSDLAYGGRNWALVGCAEITGGQMTVEVSSNSSAGQWLLADAVCIATVEIGQVTSITAPHLVTRGDDVEIDVDVFDPDDIVTEVRFYDDADEDGTPDEQEWVYTDSVDDGWSGVLRSDDMDLAEHQFLAQPYTTIGPMIGGSVTVLVSEALAITDNDNGNNTFSSDIVAGFTTTGGDWQTALGCYGEDYLFHPTGSGANATWEITGLDSDTSYHLLATWTESGSAARDAEYTISGADESETRGVDQRDAPGDIVADGQGWNTLGVYTPDSTGRITVELSASSHGIVIADAIRILESAGQFDISGNLTDFSASHTDFQGGYPSQVMPGFIQSQLSEGAPLLETENPGAFTHEDAGIDGPDSFKQWYEEPTASHTIVLADLGGGLYKYSNTSFFPLGEDNNHFTMKAGFSITYDQGTGQYVEVNNDDDVWVFINGSLAIDAGGYHWPAGGTAYLDDLSLTDGQSYTIDIFTAERQIWGSTFEITIGNTPQVSIEDAADVIEGHTGTVEMKFRVKLSQPSQQAVTVSYGTADGTATVADGDYSTSKGQVQFDPGESEKVIVVTVNGDTKQEFGGHGQDEHFGLTGWGEYLEVTLDSPTNATIDEGTGTGWIKDDDAFVVNSTMDRPDENVGDGVPTTGKLNTELKPEVTLRSALQEAEATEGEQVIVFDIPDSEPGYGNPIQDIWTIALGSTLPTITETVHILGGTQPSGGVTTPVIVVDGGNGILVTGGDTVVTALSLINATSYGIKFEGSAGGSNRIEGCYIGVKPDGTTAAGNGEGVVIYDSPSNTVVGCVISGNDGLGISLSGQYAVSNWIDGNMIGTNAAGDAAVGNAGDGIYIEGGAASNVIGITGEDDEGNVISGNIGDGVHIHGSSGNYVSGNFIGTDAGGAVGIPNSFDGVLVAELANDNFIGTDGDGVFDDIEGNVISGNSGNGVQISVSHNNYVAGNFIGTDLHGASPVANGVDGVVILLGTDNTIGTDGDGDSDDVEYNVISGNKGNGVRIFAGYQNYVSGNFIGTDVDGGFEIHNNGDGVLIEGSSIGNTIGTDGNGTSDDLEHNVISGNTGNGVHIDGGGGNDVMGNFIGTDIDGGSEIHNGGDGVLIEGGSSGNVIGTDGNGTSDDVEYNVISGNVGNGVRVSGSNDNYVAGNFIGTDIDGWGDIANDGDGVLIEAASSGNIIGTDGDGTSDDVEYNVISGNEGNGVRISGSNNNVVAGNSIGTDIDGWYEIDNDGDGVLIEAASSGNIIGTDGDGTSDDVEFNVISGNTGSGVEILGSTKNYVAGNFIGTDSDGWYEIHNGGDGVLIDGGSTYNVIGTNGDGDGDDIEGNIISGNTGSGVEIFDSNHNYVAGNLIGTDIDGQDDIANSNGGVLIANGSTGNVIGTDGDLNSDALEGNVISGNKQNGVEIHSSDGNYVAGNFIGTDVDGRFEVHNTGDGVLITDGSTANIIGTDGDGNSDDVEFNVISGNKDDGVEISKSDGNYVTGNFIGTDSDGKNAVANTGHGVFISLASDGNTIGTDGDGTSDNLERNIISGNTKDGVHISGSDGNYVANNFIGTTKDGQAALANGDDGVAVSGGSKGNYIGTNSDGNNDDNESNLISGNTDDGIHITGSSGNYVANNVIGIDVDIDDPLANGDDGVEISGGAQGNFIGTNSDGNNDDKEGNLISDNTWAGVYITGKDTKDNTVAGNAIGLNRYGVAVMDDAHHNWIGTDLDGFKDDEESNLIMANVNAGVRVFQGVSNTIIGNSLYLNGDLGIDLGLLGGVTTNDDGDPDVGANDLQNYPELIYVHHGAVPRTGWSFNSTPNTSFVISFYGNSSPDPSGHGEGEVYLKSMEVTTNAAGNVWFTTTHIVDHNCFSATATQKVDRGTSEFSSTRLADVDLDIDSDNENGLERSAAEDSIEDNWLLPGKLIVVNRTDPDGDGIPGFADGFNLRPDMTDDDASTGAHFTPIKVDLSKFSRPDLVQITFGYSGSNPSAVTYADDDFYVPAPGTMRLWKKDADAGRAVTDYIDSGVTYLGSALGFAPATDVLTFWVEAIAETSPTNPYDPAREIEVTAELPGMGITWKDNVLVTTMEPVGTASITGNVFLDRNQDRVWNRLDILGDEPDVVLVIDRSGSTAEPFVGEVNVGDVNGDGDANTILDAELAAGMALRQSLVHRGLGSKATVSVVAFDSSGEAIDLDPTLDTVALSAFAVADVDDNGVADIDEALTSIEVEGGTDFDSAIQAALDRFAALGTEPGNANLIFLTDGAGSDIQSETQQALDDLGVNVCAIGVGASADLGSLSAIDPGATRATNPYELVGNVSGCGEGEPAEPALSGWWVFLDRNGDGYWNATEPYSVSDEHGLYLFPNLPNSQYRVRVQMPAEWALTTPIEGYHQFVLADGEEKYANFGAIPDPALHDDPTGGVNVAPGSIGEGEEAIVTITDPTGYGELRYSFDMNDNGIFTDPGDVYRSLSPSAVYIAKDGPATETVNVRIQDSIGQVWQSSVDVVVENRPPTVWVDAPSRVDMSASAPPTVLVGHVSDPSDEDEAAGFTYQWLVDGVPAASVTDTLSVTFSSVADHVVTFRAQDRDGAWGQTTVTIVACTREPYITAAPSAAPATVTGTTTTLSVEADDLASEENLTYEWILIDSPQGAPAPTFSRNESHDADTTEVEFGMAGEYTFEVHITNGDGLVTESDVIVVTVDQTATSLDIQPSPMVVSPDAITDLAADVLDQFGDEITDPGDITWSLEDNESGGTIDPLDGEYEAGPDEGTDLVRGDCDGANTVIPIRVQTGTAIFGIDQQSVTGTEGTEVTFELAQFIDPIQTTDAGDYTATIDWGDGSATSAGTITEITLSDGSSAFVVSGSHEYQTAGDYDFTVTVVNVNDQRQAVISGTATVTSAPVHVQMQSVTGVVSKLIDQVVATISDDNAYSQLSEFSAEIDWGDGTAVEAGTVTGSAGEYDIAGTHVYDAVGEYEIVVTVFENGQQAAKTRATVTISANLDAAGSASVVQTGADVGPFTLPVVDLVVNVPGRDAILFSRIYDSSRADELGDFGYGWRLNMSDVNLTISTATVGNRGSQQYPSLRNGDVVSLEIPGKGRLGFQFLPAPVDYIGPYGGPYTEFLPQFVCVDGSGSRLTFVGWDDPSFTLELDGDEFHATNVDMGFNPANPVYGGGYELNLTDGSTYVIDEIGTLTAAFDPDGNDTLYLDGGGVDVGINSPTVHRDTNGRIDWISSLPDGDGQVVSYAYNANGELESVTNALGETIEYRYEQPSYDHYLTAVVDPRGFDAITVAYDPDSGKVSQVLDVAGNGTDVVYQGYDGLNGVSQYVDALGNGTEVEYDDHGSAIRTIREVRDSVGTVVKYVVTVRSYDYVSDYGVDPLDYGNGSIPYGTSYLNQLTQVREYQPFEMDAPDSAGARYTAVPDASTLTSEITFKVGDGQQDPDAGQIESVTVLAADGVTEMTTLLSQYELGKPGSVADPYGGTTRFDYDDAGNLIWTQNAAGEETYYSYTTGANYTYADGTQGLYTSLAEGLPLETWYETSPSVKIVLQETVYYGDEASPWYRGQLKQTTDAAGLTIRYAYYQDGQTKKVFAEWRDVAAEDHSVLDGETHYDELGRPVLTVGPHGDRTSIFYDTTGQLTTVKDRFGGYTVRTYDVRGNLIRTLGPDGVETRSVYDEMGRVIWSGDAFAGNSQFTFDEQTGQVTWQANDNTATYVATHYVYDSLGRVTETETYRDVTIDITASTQFAGTFVSDLASQPTSGQLLYDTQTLYDSAGRVAAYQDMDGVWTGSIFYANGQRRYNGPLTAAAAGTVPDNVADFQHYWELKYDQDDNDAQDDGLTGRYDERIDPLGNATRTYLDETNRVARTLYADGSRTQSLYGNFGEIVSDPDLALPAGFPTTVNGWLDVEFAPRQSGDPAVATIYLHDAAGRLTDVWLPPVVDASDPGDPVSPHWHYTYDANGARLSQTDPDGNTTAFAYDDFVRRTGRTLPDTLAESFVYGDVQLAGIPTGDLDRSVSAGQRAYDVDFEGRITAYLYDNTALGGGRLVEKQYFATVTDYLSSAGVADEYVTYAYDAMGRNTVVEQHRDGGPTDVTEYIYDDLGQLIRVENPQGAVNYEYDASWRLVRTYTGDAEPTYAQRTGSSDDGIAVTDTSYQYNALGRLWKAELYAHDDQALATPEVTEYQYDARGGVHLVTLPNGVTCEYTYDDVGRLDLLKHFAPEEGGGDPNDYSDNRVLAGFDYGFDSRGRRTSAVEQFDTDGQAGFELVQAFAWSYDDLDRLTAETFDLGDDGSSAGDYVTMYSFDLNDNRFSKQTQHDYSGPVAQMLADETASYTYDANGRLLQETLDAAGTADDRTTAYHYGTGYNRTEQTGKTVHDGLTTAGTVLEEVTQAYDLAGRQVSVTVDKTGGGGGVEVTTFAYDNAGNRVSQTAGQGAPAVTTAYLIDDNNFTGYSQTLEQTDRDSSDTIIKTTTYVLGRDVIGQYVTTTVGTQASIFLTDGRGSTRALYGAASAALLDAAQVSAGGAWTKTLTYDAYGNALGFDAATAATEMLYNGESFNARTGQQYLRARWYDPSAGRFGRLDPYAGNIYSPATLDGYGYCHGDPVNYVDPSGMGIFGKFLPELASKNVINSITGKPGKSALSFLAGLVAGFAVGQYIALRSNFMPEAVAGGVTGVIVGTVLGEISYKRFALRQIVRTSGFFTTAFSLGFLEGLPLGWMFMTALRTDLYTNTPRR